MRLGRGEYGSNPVTPIMKKPVILRGCGLFLLFLGTKWGHYVLKALAIAPETSSFSARMWE